MVSVPDVKRIFELIKTGATIEAQEEIMSLRLAALELQEENLGLRERVSELENQIKDLKGMGELCPKCHQVPWMLTDSVPDRQMGALGVYVRTYECPECGFTENKLSAPDPSLA